MLHLYLHEQLLCLLRRELPVLRIDHLEDYVILESLFYGTCRDTGDDGVGSDISKYYCAASHDCPFANAHTFSDDGIGTDPDIIFDQGFQIGFATIAKMQRS